MQLDEFIAFHGPALETDEIRNNLILGILGWATDAAGLRLWTFGGPGACAIQTGSRPIVLGALTQAQCARAADETLPLDHAGVGGSDLTADWFVARAKELGQRFHAPMQMRILALREKPAHPGARGCARPVNADDAALFGDWMRAFGAEAVPHDPVPSREALAKTAGSGRYLFWIVDGTPVSMAGIVRRTRHTAAIAGVYTPPPLRGRGFAGAVTAALVERIFAEGRSAACLFVDARNPASARCYAKIGFKPHCEARQYRRDAPA